MPVYEYKCESCGRVFEFFQQGKETPICPDCGSINLTRLISTPARVGVVASTGVNDAPKGTTCCGKTERCDTPPCSTDNVCRRDK